MSIWVEVEFPTDYVSFYVYLQNFKRKPQIYRLSVGKLIIWLICFRFYYSKAFSRDVPQNLKQY